MFCPSCRDEFRLGFYRCPDCDVKLVERLPEPGAGESAEREAAVLDPEESVVVLETENHGLAGVAMSLLEAEGIPVAADHFSRATWLQASDVPNPVGPVRIRVPRDREEEARALLAEQEPADWEPPADGEP